MVFGRRNKKIPVTVFAEKEEEEAREDDESEKRKFYKAKRNSKSEKVQMLKQFPLLYSTKPSEDQRFFALLPRKSYTRNHVPVEPPTINADLLGFDAMSSH